MKPAVARGASLDGRVAAISGATGGLGRIVARALADEGARLALFGSDRERLAALSREIGLPAERVLTLTTDLTQPGGPVDAAAAAVDRFGRVDIVLHLIGGWTGGKGVSEATDEEMSDMLSRHVWSTFYLAREFVPHLIANRWGRMVVVSSPVASEPAPDQVAYAAAKAAQEALVLGVARELRGSGVTGNVIVVKTIDEAHERDARPSERNAAWTTPEEIAAAILYLCSDAARGVSGARIPLYRAG